MLTTPVVIVSCDCGMFPLDNAMHSSSRLAWQAAAAHVALNPTLCRPSMRRDYAPIALAPAPDPVPPMTALFEAV